jgi:hypothetical protein
MKLWELKLKLNEAAGHLGDSANVGILYNEADTSIPSDIKSVKHSNSALTKADIIIIRSKSEKMEG